VNRNPDIWGNTNGNAMFIFEEAFISKDRPNGAENFQDIINHWKEVKKRILKLENKRK